MTEPRPFRQRWTLDELKQLEEMLNEGKTAPEIARKLNRTAQAVYSRVQRIYRKRTPEKVRFGHRVQWGLKAKK